MDMWRDMGVVRDPLDEAAARTLARMKRPCLKALHDRNPAWNPYINECGNAINPQHCEDLIEAMVVSGCWGRTTVGAHRLLCWQSYHIMEFLWPTRPEHEVQLKQHEKEIHLAGYTHLSLCSSNGWEPFRLPGDVIGWGKEITDTLRIADWYAEAARKTSTPYFTGHGWTCHGEHWPEESYPDANESGPYGPGGPRWEAL